MKRRVNIVLTYFSLIRKKCNECLLLKPTLIKKGGYVLTCVLRNLNLLISLNNNYLHNSKDHLAHKSVRTCCQREYFHLISRYFFLKEERLFGFLDIDLFNLH